MFRWIFAFVVVATPSQAQDFWKGKQLTFILGTSAGSGYDTYGRALGRHIGKHIPGNPSILMVNMPGAGSKLAAEHIALIAPKDGSTIAAVFPGGIIEPLIVERSKWRYDPTTLEYIGSADNGTRLCATRPQSAVKTFADAQRVSIVLGSTAPGGSMYDYPVMLNALTGTKFKVVSGYKGAQDIVLAIERGEIDGWCGVDISTSDSIRPDWVRLKQVNTFVQIALKPNPEMTALGIPHIWDFVPAENKAVMDLIISQQVFLRPYIAPPGTPADRVKALQSAFMATMSDADFIEDAKKMKLLVNPMGGPELASHIKRLYAASPELIERMAKAVRQ